MSAPAVPTQMTPGPLRKVLFDVAPPAGFSDAMTQSDAATIFGKTSGGEPVRAFDLAAGPISARVVEWGAVMQDLRITTAGAQERPLVIGLPRLEDYLADDAHIGAVVGRVANRLAGGRFSVAGRDYRATCNAGDGAVTLHGGARGWGRRLWRAEEAGPTRVALTLRDEDGTEGFPGAVTARCVYEVTETGLDITFEARPEAPTVVNMTHHAYFNLSGEATIDGHELTVMADRLTPLGPLLTPTGEVVPVGGDTDWRRPRRVGAAEIDVNYVLADAPRPEPVPAARLVAGGVAMTLSTTAPGLQVYTGHNLKGRLTGTDGRIAGPRAAICLEPQFWPDAPNHPGFPSIEATPERPFRQVMRLSFDTG